MHKIAVKTVVESQFGVERGGQQAALAGGNDAPIRQARDDLETFTS